MLADMVGASDPKLRQLSSRLAGRMMCEVATVGTTTSRGVGRIEALPFGTADGEIDLDASSEGLVELRAFRAMDPSKWKVRGWGRPSTAMCLLIDRSGSMTGERLAEAAIVAAAVSESVTNQRSFSPDDLSIAAFAREVIVIASADRPRHADGVVEDLLRMRGHGVTDLDAALQAAQRLLARSSATRKVTLLMSDCRSTTGPSPYASAAMLDELCVGRTRWARRHTAAPRSRELGPQRRTTSAPAARSPSRRCPPWARRHRGGTPRQTNPGQTPPRRTAETSSRSTVLPDVTQHRNTTTSRRN